MNRIDGYDPTTIVLDIVMPDIDGFELVKWLRDRGCSTKIIVASTGNLDYAKLASSLGRGRGLDISVVEKPYEVEKQQEALASARHAQPVTPSRILPLRRRPPLR